MQTMIASVYWLACCSDTGSELSHQIILASHLKLITIAAHAKLVPYVYGTILGHEDHLRRSLGVALATAL